MWFSVAVRRTFFICFMDFKRFVLILGLIILFIVLIFISHFEFFILVFIVTRFLFNLLQLLLIIILLFIVNSGNLFTLTFWRSIYFILPLKIGRFLFSIYFILTKLHICHYIIFTKSFLFIFQLISNNSVILPLLL